MNKNFLTIADLSLAQVQALLKLAKKLKKKPNAKLAKGRVLGMIFEKESTRTRVSFEVAMLRLGGHAIYLGRDASQLSRGETYADTAKVLSRYVDALVLRTSSHQNLIELAESATIPVINGLTDTHHPCQVLADCLTIIEKKRRLVGLKVAYVGDGNNMANSWIEAAEVMGFELWLACPKGFSPSVYTKKTPAHIHLTEDTALALAKADVVNTDTWFSMGQEISQEKLNLFKPYQINSRLMKSAKCDAIVLHCLPAHRGEEITSEVLDGKQSVIFDQAENRLHVQMALIASLLRKKG